MEPEKDQERLLRLLEVVDSEECIDDESPDESYFHDDSTEERIENTDTERSDDPTNVPTASKRPKQSPFVGKDGKTVWNKHNPVNRRSNISILHLPGVRPSGKHANSPIESWGLFFTAEVLECIVQNTNKTISAVSEHYSRVRPAKPTDLIEIKALLGLLYLAGCLRSSHLKVEELWERNGTGVDRFWLTMSIKNDSCSCYGICGLTIPTQEKSGKWSINWHLYESCSICWWRILRDTTHLASTQQLTKNGKRLEGAVDLHNTSQTTQRSTASKYLL